MSGPDLLRLGVLGSGHGSNFAAICRAIDAGALPAQVAAVLSDQPDARILELGRTWGAP
jgi:phosphoribosylglycinamide formyltransferase 1